MKIADAIKAQPYAYMAESGYRLGETLLALPFGDTTVGDYDLPLRTDPRADNRYDGVFGEIVGMGFFILASRLKIERFWKRQPPAADFEVLLRDGEALWIEFAVATPEQWARLAGQVDFINYGVRKYILEHEQLSRSLKRIGVEIRLPPVTLEKREQVAIVDELRRLASVIPNRLDKKTAFGDDFPVLRDLGAWWYAWKDGNQFIAWCDQSISPADIVSAVEDVVAAKNGRTYRPERPWLALHVDGRLPWSDRVVRRLRRRSLPSETFSRIAINVGQRMVRYPDRT